MLSFVILAVREATAQSTINPEARAEAPMAVERMTPDLAAWWNDTVFYQVFVRSFADSREGPLANDGIGDLRGLIDRLGYLSGDEHSLGVNGLWLMPIMPSPSYHGYDVTDYRAVNEQYGTMEDFERLLSECHARGIRVIIDWIPNHCSWEHPWFKAAAVPDSPTRHWFVWTDQAPDWKGPWNQRVWHPWPAEGPASGAAGYYYGIFSRVMPDLNFREEAVTEAVNEAAAYWLRLGVDGLRVDAIRHLIEEGRQQESTEATHQWLRGFRGFYKGVKPDAFAVGEVWAPTAQVAPYVGRGLDSAFEFDTAYATIDAINAGKRDRLAAQWALNLTSYPQGQYATFLSNHDQDRVMSRFGGGDRRASRVQRDAFDKARLAAALLLTSPGFPFIYYGEEIGMVGVKPDEDIRTPMQWTGEAGAGFTTASPWRAVNPDAATRNVADQARSPDSLWSWYRKLIRLRHEHRALRTGDMTILNTGDERVWAFLRRLESTAIVVVANLSEDAVGSCALDLPPNTGGRGVDLLTGDTVGRLEAGAFVPRETLAPREVMVIQLSPAAGQ